MTVPADNNISVKESNKISKYKIQETETEKMRPLKTSTVPVIVGALGRIKKDRNTLTRYLAVAQHIGKTKYVLKKCSSEPMEHLKVSKCIQILRPLIFRATINAYQFFPLA